MKEYIIEKCQNLNNPKKIILEFVYKKTLSKVTIKNKKFNYLE